MARQVLRFDLPAFFPPKPQEGALIVAHDDPRVRAADEVIACELLTASTLALWPFNVSMEKTRNRRNYRLSILKSYRIVGMTRPWQFRPMITPGQCRAARALLGWNHRSNSQLRAAVGIVTVHRLKLG